jgi:diamine N-acetyltransferase
MMADRSATAPDRDDASASDMSIRVAQRGDAQRLAEFAARVFAVTYAHANTPENMQAYLDRHFGEAQQEAELSDPELVTLLMERDADIIGFAQLRSGGVAPTEAESPLEVARIYVDPALHGRGAGAKLLRACIHLARQRGHDALWLGVWESNSRAISFYKKMGFCVTGEQTFVLGQDVQRDHVMVLTLRADET